MNLEDARERSAAFIRDLDPNARRLWEMPGPKGTAIFNLEAWTVKTEGDRLRVVIVQHFASRRTGGPLKTESDGWMVFAEIGLNSIAETHSAFLKLPKTERLDG